MFQENTITKLLSTSLIIIGLVTTGYVLMNTPNVEGTELFFTLPLSFVICLLSFKRIIPYHRNGFGLKVLYIIILFRYIIIPILTCYVGSFSRSTSYSSGAYRYGIIMQNIELLVTCATIYFYFPKIYDKCYGKYKKRAKTLFYDDLSLGGIFVILFCLFVIYSRGLGTMLRSMRFLVLTAGLEQDAYYGYDIWMAHTGMAFLVIVITGVFQKREDIKPSIINLIIPLVFTFFSCALSFGNTRMMTVYFALSALSILLIAFPKHRFSVLGTIVPTFVIVLASFTMIKQFGYDVTSNVNKEIENNDIVSSLSDYISTTQNIAKVYDMYASYGYKMGISYLISDVIHGVVILQIPQLQIFVHSYLSHPTSLSLVVTGSEVVPMAGQSLLYGGWTFGWLIDIVFFIVLVRMLILTDCYSKIERRIGSRYIFTWVSVLFGMLMAYNLSIIWSSLNYVPFFTWCALFVNKKLRIGGARVVSYHKYE